MVTATPVLDEPSPAGVPSPSVRRVASTVVTAHVVGALVGGATWLLAARNLPAEAVGTGLAVTGVLGWCGLVANAGLGSAVVDAAPGLAPQELAATVRAAAGRAGALGAAAGVLAALVLATVDDLVPGAIGPVVAFALVLGASATSAAIVADAAAVAAGRATLVVARSLVFAALRLALLGAGLAIGHDGPELLVAGWAVAAALAALGPLAVLSRSGSGAGTGAGRTAFGLVAWSHHAVSLAAQTPALLLPVVVAATAGAAAAAAFGAAWQIASVAALASPAMAAALFAEGRRHPAGAGDRARRARRDLLLVLVPVALGLALAGPWALDVLGPGYGRRGAAALVLVAAALVPDAVTNVAVSTWRARRRFGPALALNTTMAAVAVVGAVVLTGRHGATGAAGAWLVAQSLGAAVVLGPVGRRRAAGSA